MSKAPSSLAALVQDPSWFRSEYYATNDFMSQRSDSPFVRTIRESKAMLNRLLKFVTARDLRRDSLTLETRIEAVILLCRYPRLMSQSGWDERIVSSWVDALLLTLTAHQRLRLAALRAKTEQKPGTFSVPAPAKAS